MNAAARMSVAGRVCLVTGATGGMGRVIVTELVRAGATVVVVTRSAASGATLRHEIARTLDAVEGSGSVEVLVGDLALQSDVRRVAAEFLEQHETLHILINNAGAHFRGHGVTPEGVERHLAVNHLAGFVLTDLLLPALRAGAPARVVHVVSDTMNDTRMIKLRRRPHPVSIAPGELDNTSEKSPVTAYARSKLAALMCGQVLAERLAGTGVTVNAVHPGLVSTGIVADIAPPLARPFLGLVRRFLLTPAEGADAALRLATDPALADITGRYFVRGVPAPTPLAAREAHDRDRVLRETVQRVARVAVSLRS